MTGFDNSNVNGENGMIWKLARPAPDEINEYKEHQAQRDKVYLDHGIDKKGMAKFLIDAVEPFSEPVLDLGTGQGLTAIEIASRGPSVVTVDISEKYLHEAHLNAGQVYASVDQGCRPKAVADLGHPHGSPRLHPQGLAGGGFRKDRGLLSPFVLTGT